MNRAFDTTQFLQMESRSLQDLGVDHAHPKCVYLLSNNSSVLDATILLHVLVFSKFDIITQVFCIMEV